MHLLSTLPAFLAYFASAMGLLAAFVLVYLRITAHAEIALIRQGNMAATVALLGAVLGFAMPLASCIAHSVSLADMCVWAGVALVVQLLAYVLATHLVPRLTDGIDEGNLAHGSFLGGVSSVTGLINAACMVY
ncbi:DUF350 domain-containing protein [Pseudorhodoferax sp.]|uniref:DUF350 domain-containing protein n=1 Tax=Pseudorhodoferax sp. TaxID=1993553 RepID=UPI0039E4D10A